MRLVSPGELGERLAAASDLATGELAARVSEGFAYLGDLGLARRERRDVERFAVAEGAAGARTACDGGAAGGPVTSSSFEVADMLSAATHTPIPATGRESAARLATSMTWTRLACSR
ncbi:MAG: hypothetical protein ACYCTE_10825 [Acidimicrobiales bacterium]